MHFDIAKDLNSSKLKYIQELLILLFDKSKELMNIKVLKEDTPIHLYRLLTDYFNVNDYIGIGKGIDIPKHTTYIRYDGDTFIICMVNILDITVLGFEISKNKIRSLVGRDLPKYSNWHLCILTLLVGLVLEDKDSDISSLQ